MMQYFADGVVFGAIVALGAVGLSMVYNIRQFPNFAHGDFISIGAYWALFAIGAGLGMGQGLGPLSFGWTMLPALLLAVAAGIFIAIAIDRALYQPMMRRGGDRKTLIIAAFAVAMVLRNAIVLVYGPDGRYFSDRIQIAREILPGVRATPDEVFVVALALGVVALLHVFLTRTRLGKAMRATAENPVLARINGVDTDDVYRWTWVLSAGLAALAGVSFGLVVQIRPEMGFDLLLPLFAALVLGGVTSVYGAILAAMIVGVAESLSVMALAAEYKQAVSFGVVILILLVRPQGLLGERP